MQLCKSNKSNSNFFLEEKTVMILLILGNNEECSAQFIIKKYFLAYGSYSVECIVVV